jgi:hypothetical protein
MDIKFAKWIKQAVENAGEECDLREDYSGRGMMGRKTAGIVVSSLPLIIPILINEAYSNGSEDGDENDQYQFLCDFPLLKQDNMGKDIILY